MFLDFETTFFPEETDYSHTRLNEFFPFSGEPVHGRFFPSRPELSRMRDHIWTNYGWRMSDTTHLLTDVNIDLESGHIDQWNAGFSVARSPRLAYYLGNRFIKLLPESEVEDAHLLMGALGYRINEKYSITLLGEYDFKEGRTSLARAVVTYRLPRWYVALAVDYDDALDRFAVTVAVWPEGAPEIYAGSRRMQSVVHPQMFRWGR
jgi:hypothetical protein